MQFGVDGCGADGRVWDDVQWTKWELVGGHRCEWQYWKRWGRGGGQRAERQASHGSDDAGADARSYHFG